MKTQTQQSSIHPENSIPLWTSASRRDFLKMAGTCLGGLALTAPLQGILAGQEDRSLAPRKRVLILGGTGWLGPRIVEAALARGHEVTLFNRGETNTHLFPNVEKLRGNRYPQIGLGLEALRGREWDAVIDVWARYPSLVRAAVAALREQVDHYVFVSSIAVYSDFTKNAITEDDPVREVVVEPLENDDWGTYGARKVICERVAASAFPGRTTAARAHAIYQGLLPKPTSGLPYWLGRTRRGGEILAPGSGLDTVQYIDARDLSRWLISAIENGTFGTFNTHTTPGHFTLRNYIETYRALVNPESRLTWVDQDFLKAQGLRPMADFPQWVPLNRGQFYQISPAKAISEGLTFRPLETTARDMLTSFETHFGQEHPFGPNYTSDGLTAKREADVLEAWRQHTT